MTRNPRPALAAYTAHDLKTVDLPPLQWVVPDLIGLGLWILAAPPKTGKSWWVLSLLMAVATGGEALGGIRVSPAPVLYLALEDNKRRLRSRLGHINPESGEALWPTTFFFVNDAPTIEGGLVGALSSWLDAHPDVRIVAIDTLARVRGARSNGDDLYTSDSRAMAHLQRLALERDICILVVHHTRKLQGDDPFDTISGSYGITGPVDGMLVLRRVRGDADATLHITGRDVEDKNLALRFDVDEGSWKLLGDARVYALSNERRAIIATLTSSPGLTPKGVAEAANLNHGSVKHLLINMRDEGLLRSDGKGRYFVVHLIHPREEPLSSTGPSAVNDSIHSSFTGSPSGPSPDEPVNGSELPTLTAEAKQPWSEGPRGERSERHHHWDDASLVLRATSRAPAFASADDGVLRHRTDATVRALGASIPAWWRDTARSESRAVGLAAELVAEDLLSGELKGPLPRYLQVARSALVGGPQPSGDPTPTQRARIDCPGANQELALDRPSDDRDTSGEGG